ncbi:HYR domain-containing protein, partial [Aestuariivivens insulae]|uniref:HYR domain-containing protein n=1 Tax=Aestuariivivens insulae TaxID=1621988 RepID=UPI001F56D025
MKTNTFSLLLKAKKQIIKHLFLLVFLFTGLTYTNAQCTIDTAATGGDNIMTGTELLAYINDPVNNCTGTITIASPVDIILSTDLTIPETIDRIIIEDGGQILWDSNNVGLYLAENTAIVIENTTDTGKTTGALGSTSSSCSNTRAIYIGSVKYTACTGGGNVCVIFSEVIEAGGTIQLDPDFAIVSGTDNEVCFGPLNVEIELNGFVDGTPTYQWEQISGPGTVTFSPDDAAITTITVTDPGTYVLRINVRVPLSADCLDTFVDVFTDIEIVFADTITAGIMSITPGSGGTCNLAVDFTGSATNAGPNSTYLWDFGDGNSSTLQNPSHVYAQGGDYNVTFTITDPDAIADCNTASASDSITITDVSPTITCPPSVNVFADNGLCTASNVDLGNPTVNDDCDISDLTITNDAPISGEFPIGTTTVTWTVEDASGNTDTCEQLVTVTDNQAPVFDCSSLAQIDLNSDSDTVCSNSTDVTAPVAVDNCDGNITAVGSRSDNAAINDPWPLGTTTITWTFTDSNNNPTSCTQDVVVTDNQAPVFDCNSLAQIDLNSDSDTVCSNSTDVTAPVAVDNCDGNITAVGSRSDNAAINDPWPLGTTTITWTFTDSNNNPTSCTQDVVVTDNQAPVFNCSDLAQIDLNSDSDTVCSNSTDVTAPVAVDNCDGNITAVGSRSDNAAINDPWPLGTTTITWTFTDSNNNPTSCTQDVVVTDNQAPVFNCSHLAQIDLNSDSDTVCSNSTDVTAPVAVDNCDGNITAVGSRSDNAAINDPWPLGTTTITWTFTDSNNNPTSCTQDVVVTDNQAPVFNCSDLAQIDLNSDSDTVCSNSSDVTAPVAVDNCDGNITAVGSRSDNAAINDPWPLGTTTITWTFTDSNNNVTTCTQDVVVTDNQAPVFNCSDLAQIDLNSDSDTVCSNSTDVTAPVAVDNCDGNITAVGSRSDNAAINDPWPLGTTTITWTFTDSNSNEVSCTQD